MCVCSPFYELYNAVFSSHLSTNKTKGGEVHDDDDDSNDDDDAVGYVSDEDVYVLSCMYMCGVLAS